MRQIKLTIEYDGTNYCGWQVQPNGVTIQRVLEEAYARLLGAPVVLTSSGRTDAGVHARGMVATFRTEKELPLRAFVHGVNALVPADIAITSAVEVPLDFHPRRDALGKHYRYSILTSDVRSPLYRFRAWHHRRPLDIGRMAEAAGRLVGRNDFRAFRGANCAAKTTVRTITGLELVRDGDFIHVDVRGDGFLKHMVRVIAGTLVEVGEGKLTPEDVTRALCGGTRADAGLTAPAHGLCLMEVFYEAKEAWCDE